MWPDVGGAEPGIGDCASLWYLGVCNEFDCVGAFDLGFYTLGEAAKFICCCMEPDFLSLGVSYELAVLLGCTCCRVDDGVGEG